MALLFFLFFYLITDSKTSLQLTNKNVLISNFVYFFLSSSFGLTPAKIMDIFAVRHIYKRNHVNYCEHVGNLVIALLDFYFEISID